VVDAKSAYSIKMLKNGCMFQEVAACHQVGVALIELWSSCEGKNCKSHFLL
jgi:hypothetical protein